jgi:ferric-dicitrate binding protein FerR (iron transport regulator)
VKNISGLDNLLRKILEGKATIADKHQLDNLIASSENENSFKEVLLKQLNEFSENQVDEEQNVEFGNIYSNILSRLNQNDGSNIERNGATGKSRTRSIIVYGLSIAAVSVIAFFLGSIFSGTKNTNVAQQVIAVSYNEIKAPYGSKSEIILPDSSHVILNAGSTIRYRSDFNIHNRDISLTGEAYFKVAKNAKIPLIVQAGKLYVKAVGTVFNIKAYEDEAIIETTLVEGKVEITQTGQNENDKNFIDLNPNQKAIYIKESDSFTLGKVKVTDPMVSQKSNTVYDNILISPKVDVNQIVAWTKGKLLIKGESLENLCVELQRKYDVTIVLSDEEIKKYRFTGVLLDETLEQVLNVIKLTAPIEYNINGKKVVLSSDRAHLNDYSRHLK